MRAFASGAGPGPRPDAAAPLRGIPLAPKDNFYTTDLLITAVPLSADIIADMNLANVSLIRLPNAACITV